MPSVDIDHLSTDALVEALRQTLPISHSADELGGRLQRILAQIIQLTPADVAGILLVKSGQAHIAAYLGTVDRLDWPESGRTVSISSIPALERMRSTGDTLAISDTQTYPGWRPPPPMTGIRSFLGSPLQIDGQLVGFLILGSARPSTFGPDHLRQLALASELATARIESAVLANRVNHRVADMEAIFNITSAIGANTPLTDSLWRVIQLVRSWLNASIAVIYLPFREGDQQALLPIAWDMVNTCSAPIPEIALGRDERFIHDTVASGAAMLIDDVAYEPDYQPLDRSTQCAILLPLNVKEKLVGFIQIEYENSIQFDAEAPASLLTLSSALSSSIDNARLFEELQASEERFRQVTESINEVFWLIDLQKFEVVFISQAYEAVWGRSREWQYRHPSLSDWLQTIHEEDRDRLRESIRRASGQRSVPNHYEFRITRPTGHVRWVHMVSYPVYNETGQVYRLAIVAEDITDKKVAETQAMELRLEKERVRLLNEFVSDASHDLKTPLATMKISLHVLKRKHPDLVDRQFEVLQDEVEHLTRLVEDLLTMSRLDASEAEFERTPIDLKTLIDDILDGHRKLIERKNHRVCCEFDPGLPHLLGDPFQLRRAIVNLFMNAVNYTPDSGIITVRAFVRDSDIAVEINDNGIGIDADDIPRIFDRFYRADKARQTHRGGTGLGLAIVRKIVSAHHGQIEVESRIGEGSTFRIRLPVA